MADDLVVYSTDPIKYTHAWKLEPFCLEKALGFVTFRQKETANQICVLLSSTFFNVLIKYNDYYSVDNKEYSNI